MDKPKILDNRGYVKVFYEGKLVWEHRLVWFKKHGYWPVAIDHIDSDKGNNDISNLREVTRGENNHLRPVRKDSTTGVKGVFPNKHGYMARIGKGGVKHYLGNFKTVEEAKEAYESAKMDLYGGFYE